MSNPILHDPAFTRKAKETKEEDQVEVKGEHEQFTNQRLLTPRMRKLMNNKDAREVLQEEINESCLRLKQAKFGHKLIDIVPDHTNNYYLPDKASYFPKEKKEVSNISSKKTLKQ
jgi:hypothetical protein